MSTDQSLATLLRTLQSASDQQDLSRILSSATTLLVLLSNPLNVTLLTSQLLSAPSIWQRPDGLNTTFRTLNIFNAAASRLIRQEDTPTLPDAFFKPDALKKEEWLVAVIKGCDDKSPRWRHSCVLAGLLIGFEGRGEHHISGPLRRTLESATVKAVNSALQEGEARNELAANSIAVALSHVFDLLCNGEKLSIDHGLLLPLLIQASFFSEEGFHSGYFLGTIDADVVQGAGRTFDWSPKSSTFLQCQRMASRPLIASLGSLSRLMSFSVEYVQNVDLLPAMICDLSAFTRSLCVQWRQNKLSEIDITEEQTYLSNETLRSTLPLLWQLLRSSMFAVVVILRSLLSRALRDAKMPANGAPLIAIQTLQILRNLYFISSRMGANSFSQYSFVNLTAIDILSQYSVQAEAFLREIRPTFLGSIPQHPLDRCQDLYFLNTAEHFALVLPPHIGEELLVGPAAPYLGIGSDRRLLEIFEAAHSVMLAVLSAPQNVELLARNIRTYVDALFTVFPQKISARQFRMAVKTLIRITSPPSLIAQSQPLLPTTLLELVRYRLESASSTPSPPVEDSPPGDAVAHQNSCLSEQSVLVLTLIDALPLLPIDQLEDWLPLVAESLNSVNDASQLENCRQRFWDVLSNGEMDVDRAALCVAWWGTHGGRDMVLYGMPEEDKGPFMSGALVENSKL